MRDSSTSTVVTLPRLGKEPVSSLAARKAARMNAAAISEEEHVALLQERQGLLDKSFDGSISKAQIARLEYVRWSLDRIEDAKHGAKMDDLEELITVYEKFHFDIESLKEQLDRYT